MYYSHVAWHMRKTAEKLTDAGISAPIAAAKSNEMPPEPHSGFPVLLFLSTKGPALYVVVHCLSV